MNNNIPIITSLLEDETPGIKLSLYQPTHPASSSKTLKEDVIRFKNALRSVESSDLYDVASLGDTMKSLHALVDDIDFWKHRTHSLAVFANKDGYQTLSLPYDMTAAGYVDEQYRVSPAISMQSLKLDYYVFDINHTRPRLLHCSSQSCEELVIEGMPESFESMTDDVEYTKELQHQSGGVGAFHGHTDESALRADTMKYYGKAAAAVDSYLKGSAKPLILMGVEDRVASIRHSLSYPYTLAEYSEGSGEGMNEQEIHDMSMPILERYSAGMRRDIVGIFQDTPPTRALVGFEAIEAATLEGRVAQLLLPCFRETTDTVREGYDTLIVLQLGDDNIETESLVRSVLAQGGEIKAVSTETFSDSRPRALCRF